jgi:hypothetical protein
VETIARAKIASNVEVIPIQQINEAYERMMRSDVRYRFVIDIASLKPPPEMRHWGYALYANWQASSLVNGREHGAGESFRWNNG